jgi:hypothetical protein
MAQLFLKTKIPLYHIATLLICTISLRLRCIRSICRRALKEEEEEEEEKEEEKE